MSMHVLGFAALMCVISPAIVVATAEQATAPPAHPINLDFESGPGESGYPAGWDTKHDERLATGGQGYDVVLDYDVFHGGRASARIERIGRPGYPPNGMVIQAIDPEQWRGKTVKVSAFMKTRDVGVDAGLLLCVFGDGAVLGYDGMGDRAVTGTTDWGEQWVAVKVGEGARMIAFGAWMDGAGAVWVDDFVLSEAGDDVPVATNAALVESPPTEAQVSWLRDTAVQFNTVEAGNGFDDLEPLRAMVGDARIVALGEGTHGTREFFQMKHRLVEFLATQMGFTLFSIEASTPEAYAVNPYVLGEDGDPAALIGGMYFWTWNTHEVLDMVEWMRRFNASGAGRIEFTGFDMQTPDVAMDVVMSFLETADPEEAAVVAGDYRRLRGQKQTGFGVATWKFPVDEARGKTVRFSGYIKTEELSDGWAGLWWRVDGADKSTLAFDNMMSTGPKGTTDWKKYEILLPVSEEAVNINFGVLMPGYGKAWFDELRVELDGEPFSDPENFDFDFEWNAIEKYYASRGGSHLAHLDGGVPYSGKQSLRLESVSSADAAAGALDAIAVSQIVVERLEAARDRLAGAGSVADTEWAIHNARIVNQCMRMRDTASGFDVRDKSMAENVAWILEQNPGQKIILWAHNGHIQRQDGRMGGHLAETFGDDYLPIGFATGHGAYAAVARGEGLRENGLAEPPEGSVESFFEATGAERLMLDLRPASADDGAAVWPFESRLFRAIGAMATQSQFTPMSVGEMFDVLIYVRNTSAAVQLDTGPGNGR